MTDVGFLHHGAKNFSIDGEPGRPDFLQMQEFGITTVVFRLKICYNKKSERILLARCICRPKEKKKLNAE